MNKITVLIAEDHDIIIDGIKAMLSSSTKVKLIGEAKDGKEVVEKAKSLNPDVILMDISMPGQTGIEATGIITKKFPKIKILALTQHENDKYVLQMFKAGVSGYLLKNSRKAELIEAIECVARGEKYYSEKVTALITNKFIDNKKNDTKEQVVITSREKEIIGLIVNDLNNHEIAENLDISLRTVETHRRNIMKKLNVSTVVALIRYAIKNDIVTIS